MVNLFLLKFSSGLEVIALSKIFLKQMLVYNKILCSLSGEIERQNIV